MQLLYGGLGYGIQNEVIREISGIFVVHLTVITRELLSQFKQEKIT